MDLENFLKRHEIRIVDKRKRCYHHPSVSFHGDYTIHTEPLYTVEIPESQLIRLQKFEDAVINVNRLGINQCDFFNHILKEKYKEEALRNQYPAVQLAYEQYLMTLNLCKD